MGPYVCLWSKHSKIGGVEEQPRDTRFFYIFQDEILFVFFLQLVFKLSQLSQLLDIQLFYLLGLLYMYIYMIYANWGEPKKNGIV